jgi:NAD(P)H-dependent FMN reductase
VSDRNQGMARLLIVHHTPSPALHTLFEAVRSGATDAQIEGVEVTVRPALGATAVDVLEADGYLLGTPANLGYMSGALKHFFDQIYYPCLEATIGHPYGFYVHGNNDTGGAIAAIEKIVTGLRWRAVQEPRSIVGQPQQPDLDACWELGAAVAAHLSL